MRQEPPKNHYKKAPEEAENGLHLQNGLHLNWCFCVQNFLGTTANLVLVPEYPSRTAQLPLVPSSGSTQRMLHHSLLSFGPFNPNQRNCGVWFFFNTNTAKTQYSLFQGHILSHRVEVLSSSYRNRGYPDGYTTTACMGQRFGTEIWNVYGMKLNSTLDY